MLIPPNSTFSEIAMAMRLTSLLILGQNGFQWKLKPGALFHRTFWKGFITGKHLSIHHEAMVNNMVLLYTVVNKLNQAKTTPFYSGINWIVSYRKSDNRSFHGSACEIKFDHEWKTVLSNKEKKSGSFSEPLFHPWNPYCTEISTKPLTCCLLEKSGITDRRAPSSSKATMQVGQADSSSLVTSALNPSDAMRVMVV